MSDPRTVFRVALGAKDAAVLVDDAGLVMAGAWPRPGGGDAAAEMSAALSGISDEARRCARHLGLGDWKSIVFETEGALVALTPIDTEATSVVVVSSPTSTPLGMLRRMLTRCAGLASAWLAGQERA